MAILLPHSGPPLIFWVTLGYGMFVGYEIRKYELDKRLGSAIRQRLDDTTRRNAQIFAEELKKAAIGSTKG